MQTNPATKRKVVIIEDDPIMGESLLQRLELEGFDVQWHESGEDGLKGLSESSPDMIICDIRLPDMNGEEVFHAAMPSIGTTPIMFITGFANIDQAVRLVRSGAGDYITKPFEMDDFLERMEGLLQHKCSGHGDGVLGVSPAMCYIERILRRASAVESTVMLTGESGVGKEVAARFLHEVSPRVDKPFVEVNCAAIPLNLLESQIFGHEKGAFTDAKERHEGFAERAQDGTLFLDEIGELPFDMQAKLLRLLQERTYMRVGGKETLPFKARVISATNVDLQERVVAGEFREDLFYRINVIPIEIPPLRERPEDILPLMNKFMMEFAQSFDSPVRGISAIAQEQAMTHEWPGNIRELRNRVERAVVLADGTWLNHSDLFADFLLEDKTLDEVSGVASLSEARQAFERRHILNALAFTQGHISQAAELLGVSRTTLWEKMRKYDLATDQYIRET
ncbi:sigma-54 dependent transcriptional regulator [Magnetovibrio sp. PR-2]|uniref:sigma-54-dependent transcriptional regulator n=1 Tax=Magnetovibrio sp. PR-2 TaxID=3120356 RepID=UPI002FCDF9DC